MTTPDHDLGANVSKLRQNWALHEDGALAQRLQSQEIESHLGGNRQRNHQIRQDFPEALKEQTRELSQAELRHRERLWAQKQVEERDAELARQMAMELAMAEQEQKAYEATRDEVFARRLQNLEKRPNVEKPTQKLLKNSSVRVEVHRPEPEGTPPLPALNGDVPFSEALYQMKGTGAVSKSFYHQENNSSRESRRQNESSDTTFQDLQGGIKYNDEQYLVKVARPALVKAEPVYANNKPEHYAVSNVSEAAGASRTIDLSPELLGAAGLSQKDLVLSKRVEAQLEQEKRDREIARRLQEQLTQESFSDNEVDGMSKAEIEAKDLELALALQEKEKAKLRRAKERSRLKKELAKCSQEEHHQQLNHSPESQKSSSDAPLRDEDDYTVPSRRPYMNRNAIDTHVSSCSDNEPQYENVKRPNSAMQRPSSAAMHQRPGSSTGNHQRQISSSEIQPQQQQQLQRPNSAANHQKQTSPKSNQPVLTSEDETPVPPYMPMQHSKKSSSLERRLNKKKEGCKQQ